MYVCSNYLCFNISTCIAHVLYELPHDKLLNK